MLIAFLCGLIVSVVYRWTYEGPNYSHNFVQSLVLLSMITALVIMVIGNNLARAFGLVGAMSIIRFRTAVKDMQDIVLIFFALASGMAAGVGLRIVSLIGTGFIGLVLIVMSKTGYGAATKEEFLLQFNSEVARESNAFESVLDQYSKRYRLINMQSIGAGNVYEYTFYVTLKRNRDQTRIVEALNEMPEISNVRFYFDE